MIMLDTYVQKGRSRVKGWLADTRVRMGLHIGGHILAGLVLAAAALADRCQPLVMGLIVTAAGWQALLLAVGGALGYLLFWGGAGVQGVWWCAAALAIALAAAQWPQAKRTPLLLPAAAALAVAATGLTFQLWLGDGPPVPGYLLRVALAGAAVYLFPAAVHRRDPVSQWLLWGFGVLALAQVAPAPWLCLGFGACAALSLLAAFPVAALAGLALDLACVTPVPMAAVSCLVYLARLVPGRKWLLIPVPAAIYLGVMGLCGQWDLMPVVPLLLGGVVSVLLPGQTALSHRRGHTGVAQVRLEMTAGVYVQMQQLLQETAEPAVDTQAVLQRAADRACSGCPCRKGCREREQAMAMPPELLNQPLLDGSDLPVACRKPGRLLAELHRGQEQLRTIRADRERRREYRAAVAQQYRFLAEYNRQLSDTLSRRAEAVRQRFSAEVEVYANRPREDNGDRVCHFAGTGGKYYVILCDGMGSGLGAVHEGQQAVTMLRRLLCAGFPPEHALQSLNSLCALCAKAGVVSLDLAEISLDTGKTVLHKWGGAPSCLISRLGAEKIGTAVPPPGLTVDQRGETVERLSLGRGEKLLLFSDGVDNLKALRCCQSFPSLPPGELAERILQEGAGDDGDDATVAVIRLTAASMGKV